MRQSMKLALLLLVLLAVVIGAASCGKKDVEEISVNDEGMPQLVHVLGEDLDLSNGLLVVKQDGKTTEIAMDAEGVSVSGYDKNTLGEQTITITYGGVSTQITVTVVERMTVSGAVTNYLIGENFDSSKGSLKITRNDGTTYTVNMNNPKVSVEGFSATAAGQGSVTVKYNAGTETYTAALGVKIYAIDTIEFTKKPTKLSYNSHEAAEIDLAGGSITLRGMNGSIEKVVPLTSATASGLDLSLVTEQNSPYKQTITVTYAGKTLTYDVNVVYTSISKFKDSAAPFMALDWTTDVPEISDELGQQALALMESYLNLTKAQTTYITSKEKLAVARAAFLYGMNQIDDDLIALENAFYLNYGQVVFSCESYDAVETAIAALANKNSDLYTITPILSGILEQFAEDDFDGNAFGAYGVISVEEYGLLSEMLQFVLDLYDSFENVPTNWRDLGASHYSRQIEDIYAFIQRSGYFDAAYAELFYAVTNWRQGDDIFDLFYTYFYEVENMDAVVDLASVALPTVLDELLYYLMQGVEKMYSFVQYYDAFDTTEFLRCYYKALKLSEQILGGNDEMEKMLYNELPLNTLLGFTDEDDIVYYFDTLIEYLEIGEGGVQYCAVSLFGTPEYHNLLDKYMNLVINLYENENFTNTSEYRAAVEDMFATFLALSPAQQYNFLSSLNPLYYGMYPEKAFDAYIQEGEDYTCMFVQILNDYYRGKFSDSAAADAYNNLMIAIEIYAQRATLEDWKTEFNTRYDNIKSIYSNMSNSDKAVFDLYFSTIFSKYELLLIRHSGSGNSTNLGEWADEFEALNEALTNAGEGYQLLSEGLTVYAPLFSAYERATQIANHILKNAPKSIVEAYYHDDLFSIPYTDSDGYTITIQCSYDFAMQYYRSGFATGLVMFTYADQSMNIYAWYNELNMGEVMNACYDIIWSYFNRTPYDREATVSFMEMLSKLDSERQVLFFLMEIEGFYYAAIDEFINSGFTSEAADVADKLIALEQAYLMYLYYPVADNYEGMVNALDELKTAYEGLSVDGKTVFEDLEQVYLKYVEICEKLIEEA